jgi:O-antigen biosynthesis protein
MAPGPPTHDRITVDGKFFRQGGGKFFLKGVTYGPFAPQPETGTFGSRDQTRRDFGVLQELGANTLRLYYPPPEWFMELAVGHGLKLLIDIPWPKHLCFFESEGCIRQAREAVRGAVLAGKGHPAVMAYSVVNEIPADVARWSGPKKVERFIDDLITEARQLDGSVLYTFASFPPTEYLSSACADFVCFNVYLHHSSSLRRYLARLQTLAGAKPLVLGEFGFDSIREGEPHKRELLAGQLEACCRGGLAGTVVYSFTDDWYRGGQQIEDWAFGLTTRERQPKPSFYVVQAGYKMAPYFPLPRTPRVSVVVASYNGGRTLETCLKSLCSLNYPDYEVILVDDGSTDNTQEIAARFPRVRNIRQQNLGLSAARNTGIAAATGEIVTFTDSDCRADEDWLYYLVGDLISGDFQAIGGHNFLPPEDSWVAAAVMVSPGGPAHVMLTDTEAEHVPGCNMAFYKWALVDIGGFDPVFRKAGDDVDVCWRLQERGHRIGFSAAGFVWHYRRSTVKAYLRQQAGYGEAEALLTRKHPEYFNLLGGGIWRGRIYTPSKTGVLLGRNVIYHGVFGSGFFQKLYAAPPAHALMLCTSLEYHSFFTAPLILLAIWWVFFLPLAIAALLVPIAISIAAASQAELPPNRVRFWSRPLVALLFFLQPLVRGWARYRTQLHLKLPKRSVPQKKRPLPEPGPELDQLCFWACNGVDRLVLLQRLRQKLETTDWQVKTDSGWDESDMELRLNRWSTVSVTTVNEYLGANKIFHRCRLRARWSLTAVLGFALASVLTGILITHLASLQPWIWMILLLLPILAWYFEDERLYVQSEVAAVLNEAAAELKIEPYRDSGASLDKITRPESPATAQPALSPAAK